MMEGLTADEAFQVLRHIFQSGLTRGKGGTALHLFGIRYDAELEGVSLPDVLRRAGLPDSYVTDINYGRALAPQVRVVGEFP